MNNFKQIFILIIMNLLFKITKKYNHVIRAKKKKCNENFYLYSDKEWEEKIVEFLKQFNLIIEDKS